MVRNGRGLRILHIEVRARDIIDRLLDGRPIEDATVELRTRWPDDINKAARRISGHANAPSGVPVLWLIGIDEKRGRVVGASLNELANWYAAVQSEFDEMAPGLLVDVNIPHDEGDVVAPLFETVRAPYVMKDPRYGKPSGGPVEREVPWQQGRSPSATHDRSRVRSRSGNEEFPMAGALMRVKQTQEKAVPFESHAHLPRNDDEHQGCNEVTGQR
jgi:hypothetical protein